MERIRAKWIGLGGMERIRGDVIVYSVPSVKGPLASMGISILSSHPRPLLR